MDLSSVFLSLYLYSHLISVINVFGLANSLQTGFIFFPRWVSLPDAEIMIYLSVYPSDAGRDWGQEKGMTEDEMAGWHHQLDGREFAWTPGVGDGQGSLVCCDSWGRKESDTTERLNWTDIPQSTWNTDQRMFREHLWTQIDPQSHICSSPMVS